MRSFLQTMKRWREERNLIKNPAKQDDQKVKASIVALHHEEREFIDNVEKRNNEQVQALLAALHKLQCNMDPLIAAQVYNSRFCPLTSRFPDELLLCILDFLHDDVVTLSCLRMASRKFLYIIGNQLLRQDPFSDLYHPSLLSEVPKGQFRRLIQRDGRCTDCRQWNETCDPRYSDRCKFRPRSAWVEDFAEYIRLCRKLHCYACDSLHSACEFSFENRQYSGYW